MRRVSTRTLVLFIEASEGRSDELEDRGVRCLHDARDCGRSVCGGCEHDSGQLDGDGEHGDRA
jgi:hypothetical protein